MTLMAHSTTAAEAAESGSSAPTPHVRIRNLVKRFRRRQGAGDVVPIDQVSLDIARGELLVLLGPSGCGKTTLLRSVAGLERPDEGSITIEGVEVFASARRLFVPPNRRPISMIFQSYALWPHMTIFSNVAYPLRARKLPKAAVAKAVARGLERVGLAGLENQYPGQLSGGQQQRVALARALVSEAELILFDEPLSNVDAKVREELRAQIIEVQREIGFTALYVTHDQAEAMELADRIAVLDRGRIEQLAPPREVYRRPRSRYVAEFVGLANLLPATLATAAENPAGGDSADDTTAGDTTAGDTVAIDTELGRIVAKRPGEEWAGTPLSPGQSLYAMFRPEECDVSLDRPQVPNAWPAELERISYTATHYQYLVRIGEQTLRVWTLKDIGAEEGGQIWIAVAPECVHLLPEERSISHAATSTGGVA
ncbi:ABC transporter ATP-binding protein [Actinopolymorpha alba]|uniref:ABC transporter ATP-binding protein n=1 Tax=Actinopolymorpha alba TaxID=533267 RepID=UPI000379C5CE|nr:ABC transporter ATP-binding protein [Actinopolymorpha alba]